MSSVKITTYQKLDSRICPHCGCIYNEVLCSQCRACGRYL